MARSLYERIGGDEMAYATINKMYDKVLSDKDLAPFFENLPVDSLCASQTAFVMYAFGAAGQAHISGKLRAEGKIPAQGYSGDYLRTTHSEAVAHGLSKRHFTLVANHLKDALKELHVANSLINEVLQVIAPTRKDVLNQ